MAPVTEEQQGTESGVVSAVLPLALRRQLEAIAEREERTLSAVIRRACAQHVRQHLEEAA